VIESVNWNSVFSSSFHSLLINKPAAGAVEMWNPAVLCRISKPVERVELVLGVSTLSMGGISTAPAQEFGAQRRCSFLPPRSLRIDSPCISMR